MASADRRARKLIIIGCGGTAEMIADYFERDLAWEVIGFAVEYKFLRRSFLGLHVVPFERLDDAFSKDNTYFFVGIGENDLNHLRTRFYSALISNGWKPASYISPQASVSGRAHIGKHCFLAENVVVQAGARIGDNVIALPNTFLAHHACIGDNVFCSAGVNISGFAHIGDYNFIGSNAAISNCVHTGSNCLIGMGCSCGVDLPESSAIIAGHDRIMPAARDIFNQWHKRVALKANVKLQTK